MLLILLEMQMAERALDSPKSRGNGNAKFLRIIVALGWDSKVSPRKMLFDRLPGLS
jgi:hypothetical protein